MEKLIYRPTHAITVISMLLWIYHQYVILEYIQVTLKMSMKQVTKSCQFSGIPRTLEEWTLFQPKIIYYMKIENDIPPS